ncbi:hypothetical protein PHMEG_00030179 [Phytophthora megakarya]|uniref:Uncharacterized protein n=1 Tax=Phytophthora megakarya TaxID=4795 RepID=A0A225V0T5_9STRA|nr:hypothetical protein PHMEG_00030179 [Phytophthora megakarya]
MYLVPISDTSGGGADYMGCGEVVHLRSSCPGKKETPDFTLAVGETTFESARSWILDSGFSRHLASE